MEVVEPSPIMRAMVVKIKYSDENISKSLLYCTRRLKPKKSNTNGCPPPQNCSRYLLMTYVLNVIKTSYKKKFSSILLQT